MVRFVPILPIQPTLGPDGGERFEPIFPILLIVEGVPMNWADLLAPAIMILMLGTLVYAVWFVPTTTAEDDLRRMRRAIRRAQKRRGYRPCGLGGK